MRRRFGARGFILRLLEVAGPFWPAFCFAPHRSGTKKKMKSDRSDFIVLMAHISARTFRGNRSSVVAKHCSVGYFLRECRTNLRD